MLNGFLFNPLQGSNIHPSCSAMAITPRAISLAATISALAATSYTLSPQTETLFPLDICQMLDVIYSILGTFLGAVLGIPAGLTVNRLWRDRANAARREQLRTAILNAVTSNAHLVDQIRDWTQGQDGCPSFNVDLSMFEATASLKYEVLDDFELCQAIDHLRFELSHLARKVDKLFDLEFDPSASMSFSGNGSRYNQLRPQLIQAIGIHLDPIFKCIEELKSRLEPTA